MSYHKSVTDSIKYLWAKGKLRYVYKYSLLKATINMLNIVSDLSIFRIGFLTTQRRWQTCYDYISVLQNKRNWIWHRITIFISKFDFRINVYLQPLHVNILFFESSSFGWFSLLLHEKVCQVRKSSWEPCIFGLTYNRKRKFYISTYVVYLM